MQRVHPAGLFTFFVVLFLIAPILIVIGSSVSSTGYMSFPPSKPSLRWFVELLNNPEWLFGFGVTLLLAVLASTISVIVALCVALLLARRRIPARAGIELLVLLPLVFPHAALAVAVLALVRDLHLIGTFTGVLLAHILVTLPFAYRPIMASLSKLDISLEEAAMSLRATPWTTFRRVTLPLIRPGLITAMLFSVIISFDELTITMFLIGPTFTTLPVKIFSQLQDNASPIIAAVATVLIVSTATLVLIINRFFGLEFFADPEKQR